MQPSQILEDQIIYVKRGRTNGLGFEPAWNAYFDFYLDTRYFGKALLQLEDVTFHLYLRKNINDKNPKWKMPTMRQMKKKFGVGHPRIGSIIERLQSAHLLKKESGIKPGQPNVANNYILSDPIPTLQEFLTVAAEGVFGLELKFDWCAQNKHTEDDRVLDSSTPGVPEMSTDQQTLLKQTWDKILSSLRESMLPATFTAFLADTDLEVEGSTAFIRTSNTFAHGWIENRMKDKLLKLLNVELHAKSILLTELQCIS
jgi:hypothetical protein